MSKDNGKVYIRRSFIEYWHTIFNPVKINVLKIFIGHFYLLNMDIVHGRRNDKKKIYYEPVKYFFLNYKSSKFLIFVKMP